VDHRKRVMSEEDRVITCTRKDGYTFAQAKRIARKMRRRTDEAVLPYRCPVCKKWHVGEDNAHELKKAFRKGAGA
jgi:hypothetical protein